MQLIVFCPPDVIFQHSAANWASAIGPGGMLVSSDILAEEIAAHLGGKVEYRLFEHYQDNPLVEVDVCALVWELEAPLCVALDEADVLRVARINDRLGVSMGAEGRAMFYRDKFFMKQRARNCGLAIADMAPLANATEALRFSEQFGFPLVIKPRHGRGWSGVEVIEDMAGLRHWLSQRTASTFHNLMIESHVRGDHYLVDGLYIEGRPILLSPARVIATSLDCRAGKPRSLYMLDAGNPVRAELLRYARALVEEVLPSEPTLLFQLEVRVTEDGEIALCQIAMHQGDAFTHLELEQAWGLDLRMTYLRALRDAAYRPQPVPEPRLRVGHLSIAPRVGLRLDVPGECPLEGVLACRVSARRMIGAGEGEVFSATVSGSDESTLRARLEQVGYWFDQHCGAMNR